MRTHRVVAVLSLAALLWGCAPASQAQRQPIPIGFEVLNNLDLLPLAKEGVVCKQHSSYDRTGGNDDGFSGTYTHLRKTDAGEFVIFDADGPGCIYRFWSAQPPEGYVKFFFDGESQPRLTCNFREMFQGKVPPFAPPLTGLSSGGWYSYFPITFAKNCTIVTEKQTGFLAIAYHRFPKDTKVETFSQTLSPDRKKVYDAIQARFADPAKKEVEAGLEMKVAKVPATDGEFKLVELTGPATIEGLHMKVKADLAPKWEQVHTHRKTVLRVYWDGDPRPAIECPLGEFFGTGFGDTQPDRQQKPAAVKYAAATFGMTEGFYYFRLPMPFRKSARITIENGTGKELALAWAADLRKGRVPQDAAYLHVQWRNHMTRAGEYVPILETTGRGHYVGTVLSMQSPHWLTYLEGDEEFFVDGEQWASIHGTGTEDYFNCGWYYKDGPVSRPFHGLTAMPDWQSRTSQYRMHVPDCVPFTKSLKVRIEHGEANDRQYTNYAIVAFWYQDSTSHEVHWKLPPARELRFPGLLANNPGMGTFGAEQKWTAYTDLVPGLDVAAGMKAGGDRFEVVPFNRLDENWDGPQRVLVSCDRPGAFLSWQVEADRDDLYALDLVIPKGRQFGIVELLVDGQPTGYKIDLYSDRFGEGLIPGETPFFMKAGPRRLELRVTGKNEKAQGFNMAPGSYLVRGAGTWPKQWNVVGPFPGGDDAGYSTAYPPEKGVDLGAKYPGVDGKEIAWTKLEAKDLVWLHPKFTPNVHCVAYAHLYVKSPDDRKATAFIGVDDAGKLFINGELVWAVPGIHHLKADEHAVPVRLKAGWNEVLIKVGQCEGAWGYAFRLQDPRRELTYSTGKGPLDEKKSN